MPYEGQTAAWYGRSGVLGRKRAWPWPWPWAGVDRGFDEVEDLITPAIHRLVAGHGIEEREGGTPAVVTMPDLAPLSAPRRRG